MLMAKPLCLCLCPQPAEFPSISHVGRGWEKPFPFLCTDALLELGVGSAGIGVQGWGPQPLTEEGSPGGTFRTFLGCPSAWERRRKDGIL